MIVDDDVEKQVSSNNDWLMKFIRECYHEMNSISKAPKPYVLIM